MGETLRTEEVVKMEKRKNEVQKSKVKNGETSVLLDPATQCKLMRLFSKNTNVNLCLPVIKLHRLEACDLKRCQGLSQECTESLRLQLRRFKHNARRRANRKMKKMPGQLGNMMETPLKNISNNIGGKSLNDSDIAVPGSSKGSSGIVKKCDGQNGTSTPYKKLKTETKQKKALKKKGHHDNFDMNTDLLRKSSSVKDCKWEEQYIPTLAGPRAPLPPAPMLNLNLPRPEIPIKQAGSVPAKPFPFHPVDSPFVPPPPLKPIHPSAGHVQQTMKPCLLTPPPLHVGGATMPGLITAPATVKQEVVQKPTTAIPFSKGMPNPAVQNPDLGVLPAAPNLFKKQPKTSHLAQNSYLPLLPKMLLAPPVLMQQPIAKNEPVNAAFPKSYLGPPDPLQQPQNLPFASLYPYASCSTESVAKNTYTWDVNRSALSNKEDSLNTVVGSVKSSNVIKKVSAKTCQLETTPSLASTTDLTYHSSSGTTSSQSVITKVSSLNPTQTISSNSSPQLPVVLMPLGNYQSVSDQQQNVTTDASQLYLLLKPSAVPSSSSSTVTEPKAHTSHTSENSQPPKEEVRNTSIKQTKITSEHAYGFAGAVGTNYSSQADTSSSADPMSSSPSSVKSPQKRRLLAFATTMELEEFIINWLRTTYEACHGEEVEQYKVQGHFQLYLSEKGRKHTQPHPILNCLKKAFGEGIYTRRHRSTEGIQRWYYCHIKLREGVPSPTIKPPKSKHRKRNRNQDGIDSSSSNAPSGELVSAKKEIQQPSGPGPKIVRVTHSLAVLTHLINTTRLTAEDRNGVSRGMNMRAVKIATGDSSSYDSQVVVPSTKPKDPSIHSSDSNHFAPSSEYNNPVASTSKSDPLSTTTKSNSITSVCESDRLETNTESDPLASVSETDPLVSISETDPHPSVSETDPLTSVSETDPHTSASETDPLASVLETDSLAPIPGSDPLAPVPESDPNATVNETDPLVSESNALVLASKSLPIAPTSKSDAQAPISETPTDESDNLSSVSESDPLAPVSESDPLAPVSESDPLAPVSESDPLAPVSESDPLAPVSESDPLAPVSESDPLAPVSESDPLAPISESDPLVPVSESDPFAPISKSDFLLPVSKPLSSTPISESDSCAPIDESDLVAPFSKTDTLTPKTETTRTEPLPENSHFNVWLQSEITKGKKVCVGELLVSMKKIRHCHITNNFIKRHRINQRSGLRVRQSLRTWDIRSFLRTGGKKHIHNPLIRSKRSPKVGPIGSKSAAVQEMLMQARIGVEGDVIIDDTNAPTSITPGGVIQRKPPVAPRPDKEIPKDLMSPFKDILPQKFTPFFGRRDKYLLMKNDRLTDGQRKFAFYMGLSLAKRARKNRRLDRVQGSDRLLDERLFGLRNNSASSNWSVQEEVRDGKKGTTAIYNPNKELKIRTKKVLKKLKPKIPHTSGHASNQASTSGYNSSASSHPSGNVMMTDHHKMFAALAFPPAYAPNMLLPQGSSIQTTAASTPTVVSSTNQNPQDFSRAVMASSSDNNRCSPPPRLTFMGSSASYVPGSIRENPMTVRVQRPMPPPLSFMGPTVESQGRPAMPPTAPQISNPGPWSGNVDYQYHQTPAMRNFGVINHTRQIISGQHSQHPPKQPLNIPSPAIPQQHYTHSSSHVQQGATMVNKQQVSPSPGMPSHTSNQRPSSLPQSVQGQVILDKRPPSEPNSSLTTGQATSSSSAVVTEAQSYKAPVHFPPVHYSTNGNPRPVYNLAHKTSADQNVVPHAGHGQALQNQQFYSQPYHVQAHNYQHQQQPNVQHNVPRHIGPTQQLSSQPYSRSFLYPNQQMQNVQSHPVQHQNHPQDGQVYVSNQQMQLQNQPHTIKVYTSSHMNSGQGQTANQQLSSSYSIQNLMLPVQVQYHGSAHAQEGVQVPQSSSNMHMQNVPNSSIASAPPSVQRQPPASSGIWSNHFRPEMQASNRQNMNTPTSVMERSTPCVDEEDSSAAGKSNASASSKTMEECSDNQYSRHNMNEILKSALSRNEQHSVRRKSLDNVSAVTEDLDSQRTHGGVESSAHLVSKVQTAHSHTSEGGAPRSESQSTAPQKESNKGSQSIINDEFLQMSLDFAGKEQANVIMNEQHPSGSYQESDQSNVPRMYKENVNDKGSHNSFANVQEPLPCDLDQINVSRFGLEENLNISSILQDTDKRSYQRDGLFDKLDNQESSSGANWQPVIKDIRSLSEKQVLPAASGEACIQDQDTGNFEAHLSKMETLLQRLVDSGLPTTYESMGETALQLLEMEGFNRNSCQASSIHKWYDEFSAKLGPQVLGKYKKNQLSDLTENEVALWINKAKGEMLAFSDVPSVQVFYMQELNFFLDKQTKQIKFHKMFAGDKICSNEKDTVSVLFTFNAAGQIGPGMIIFPRMVIPERLFASLRNAEGGKDWVIGSSSNGWLYGDCISEFVSDVFIPWLQLYEYQQPVALFTTDHISNVPLGEMCQSFVPDGVHLVLVPKGMSPIVSPAEKIFVNHFITQWGKSVRDWSLANGSKTLVEENFAAYVISAIRSRISKGQVVKVFREVGLWPFDGRLVFEQFQHKL